MQHANVFSRAVMTTLGVAGVLFSSVAAADPQQRPAHHKAAAVSVPDPQASYYPRLLYPSTAFPSTTVLPPTTRTESAAPPSSGLTLPAYRPPPMSRLHLRARH